MTRTAAEPVTIEGLVARFADNIRELKQAATKEATLRVQYLDPFFKLLGWDVANDAGLPLDRQEVIIEPSIEVAERDRLRARRPDYLFRIDGQPQLTCEAKKPAVEIDRDKDAIFQAKRDAYSMGLPFAILTDFEQFRVYDTGYQPDYDSPRHGLVAEFSLGFADYPAQWDVLKATFGREAVAGGSLDRLRARVRRTRAGQRIRGIDRQLFELRGDKPAGDAFLGQLEQQRRAVAADIYTKNRSKFTDVNTPRGAARLAEYTQRLLDRVVFMRICEDRGVVNYGILRDLIEESRQQGQTLRDLLIRQFRQFDRDFNGYIFKPHDIETCDFTPAVLRDLIAQFYPPETTANFAVLPDDLLATVYERFLGSTITVKRGRVEIEEKPEVRHAGGVYYTPKFVVDSILRRVVAPKLADRAPRDLLDGKLTILDPACGSGSFLIAAFDMLVKHCERVITNDPRLAQTTVLGSRRKHPIAFQQTIPLATSPGGKVIKTEKVWRLTPDFKGRLLTDCILGVDIDQQAVEVTIMSLYAKVLSDLPEDWRGISEHRILPPLDNNIRCGNSLIDQERLDAYAEHLHGGLFAGDENVRFRINAFDWHSETRGFGRILGSHEKKDRGFDCVIGNPPYIRVQELNKWAPEECQFYKWQYKSAGRGNYDIYVCFTERVLTGGKEARGLLKLDGTMGFIMPQEWWKASYGEGLRELVSKGRHLCSVIDFTDQQVFQDATTYTAIQVFGKAPNSAGLLDVAVVSRLVDGTLICESIDAGVCPDGTDCFTAELPSTLTPWVFQSASGAAWRAKVSADHPTLLAVADSIFVGLQTSADTVFLFKENERGSRVSKCFSKELGLPVEIETALLRPVVRSGRIRRYWAEATAQVLFPYRVEGARAVLIPVAEMKSRFPYAWEYLRENEELLRGRENGKFNHDEWYGLMRKNLELWEGPKVMVPYMVTELSAWYDHVGNHYFVNVTTGGFGIRSRKISPWLLTGILCSDLMDAWFKTQARRFHSGYFGANKQYIENLPIKLPSTAAEKKLAGRIEASVRQIMEDKKRLASGQAAGDRDRRDLEARIETAERRIDADVMKLYGVDRLPGEGVNIE